MTVCTHWDKWNIVQRHLSIFSLTPLQNSAFSSQIKCFIGIQHFWLKMTPSTSPGWCLHGVVVVGHQARRFTTGGVLKTRVVGITEDSLDPWQDPCWGHGLVGEVAWGRGDTVGFQRLTQVTDEYLWTRIPWITKGIIFLSLWIDMLHIFSGKELFAYIHVDGRVDSLSLATLVPWTALQATWSPWRNAPCWRVQYKLCKSEFYSKCCLRAVSHSDVNQSVCCMTKTRTSG